MYFWNVFDSSHELACVMSYQNYLYIITDIILWLKEDSNVCRSIPQHSNDNTRALEGHDLRQPNVCVVHNLDDFQNLMGLPCSKLHLWQNLHKDLITFSSDMGQTVEKCPISKCWRILQSFYTAHTKCQNIICCNSMQCCHYYYYFLKVKWKSWRYGEALYKINTKMMHILRLQIITRSCQ